MLRLICLLCLLSLPVALLAQEGQTAAASGTPDLGQKLDSIQVLIDKNTAARAQLRDVLSDPKVAERAERQQELEQLLLEHKQLRAAFEQMAIGSIDVNVLSEGQSKFDWREEITLVLQPIMENLKALTDKPRKVSQLSALIEQNALQRSTIEEALVAIAAAQRSPSAAQTQSSLEELLKSWQRMRDNNQQERELAQTQLAALQNSQVTWQQLLRKSATDFFYGRGLTLLLAVAAALLVWLVMRSLLWLMQLRTRNADVHAFRTRKRLAQYAYNALMMLLVLMAVIAVFYLRGDLLLLGLSILATASIALGLRQAIPRFIAEAQLLLNLGAIRERERVVYNGLPWQVAAINMYSLLKNPELSGTLRLPLRDLAGLISRPNGQEAWFPSSTGDFIVLEEEKLWQVLTQSPETVELRDAAGTLLSVTARDFFGWNFKNLSRAGSFGVSCAFGVDYQLQAISADEVPAGLRQDIMQALQNDPEAEHLQKVVVELANANSSSLDYYIYLTLHSDAARSYLRLRRLVQRVCVASCTRHGWGIPFPHLTVQQLPATAQPTAIEAN